MKYNIVDEINSENERRFWWPFIAPVVLTLSVLFGIGVVYVNGPAIDAYATKYPFHVVAVWVPLCLFGLWRMFKMNAY